MGLFDFWKKKQNPAVDQASYALATSVAEAGADEAESQTEIEAAAEEVSTDVSGGDLGAAESDE